MSRITSIVLFVAISLAVAGCQSSGGKMISEKDRDANRMVSQNWLKATQTHNWDAVGATYAADAILMPPNSPAVTGRENIKKYFATFPAFSDLNLTPVEIDGRGNLAFVRGTYSMNILVPNAQPIHEVGKYIEIRRKEKDGAWLIWRDIFNSDNPEPK